MNWPFWSLSRPSHSESCEDIETLLSLYADGMASPNEVRRVEAHLPGCDDCREVLSWMQVTHRTLAARPVAIPPANLHSRIALAIAASSAAPISLRPARTFALRSSYAAAASVTVLGLVLGYSLWHPAADRTVAHTPKPITMAALPSSNAGHKTNAIHSNLPHTASVKLSPVVVASNNHVPESIKPNVVKHLPAVKKTEPTPLNELAEVVPASHTAVPTLKVHVHAIAPHTQLANSRIVPTKNRLPNPIKENLIPKQPETTKIADREPAPPPVQVRIMPSTVTEQPSVRTASASTQSPPKLRDTILGAVVARTDQMAATALLPIPVLYHETATAIQSLDSEHAPHVYSPIYSDTANK
ncbi:MAG: zf-HC2 domain-containing protein [Janthinobacterium lividum]